MSSRLWYPQLDVFDTIRRLCILLNHFDSPPGHERLCIADFFLANPPLLHNTNMTQDVRNKFSDLKIPRPSKCFISYPEAPLLFHKMKPIQKEAINAICGKGIICLEKVKIGLYEISDYGRNTLSIENMYSKEEINLCFFLINHFAKDDEISNRELRRRTGLRRAV